MTMENFDYKQYLKNNPLTSEQSEEKVINESVNEDARTDAEQEGYEDGFKDAKADMRDKLSKMKVSELKAQIRERILNELQEEVNEQEEENVDVDVEKDVDIDITDKEEVDVDDESVESDINVRTMVPGESADVEAVQGLLTKAQQQAEKLGDDKLLDQIGNTITYFTRAHVVKVNEDQKKTKRSITEDEERQEDSEEIMGKIPQTIWAKFKADIKKPIDVARHLITFYKELVDGENFDPQANPAFAIAIGKLQDVSKQEDKDLSKDAIKSEED